jgi:hypothetical protein
MWLARDWYRLAAKQMRCLGAAGKDSGNLS